MTVPAAATTTRRRPPIRTDRGRPSLTGRIVVTTVAVALVAVAAVSVVGFQLVRQESIGQTRLVLRSSAQAIAVSPAAERRAFAARIERRSGGRVDVGFAGDGSVSGLATALPSGLEARLGSTTKLSVRQVDGWRTLLVEAVPERGGRGSVVAVEDVSILHRDAVLARFAVALLIGVLVAVVFGVGVARFVTRPLRGIVASASRLAAGERGVLAADGPPDSADPGRAAAPSTDVREVAAIRGALRALDAELVRSEEAQHEFLLSISHEFRTPLAAVRGYADALADGLVPPEDLQRVGRVVGAETERLDAFVADLLALARLEAEDFPIRLEQVDAVPLVSGAVAAWSGRAATLGVTLSSTAATPRAVLVTDAHRVRQVVDGLVENALRVARPDGTVEVSVDDGPAGLVLGVVDDGPGLDAVDLQRAFVRGALRERHRDDRPVGTGLGLSIAARLVERLGGSITAVRRDVGAEFRVVLPHHPPADGTRAPSGPG